ncbi:MAG: hypothetical protein WC145_12210 [Aliarcobacter sp.]|jgi:hypothetical protein
MTGINNIIAVAVAIFAVMIMVMYGISALGAVDGAQNMTGSPYEEQYNASVGASTTSFSIVQYIPLLLGVFAIVGVFVLMKKML